MTAYLRRGFISAHQFTIRKNETLLSKSAVEPAQDCTDKGSPECKCLGVVVVVVVVFFFHTGLKWDGRATRSNNDVKMRKPAMLIIASFRQLIVGENKTLLLKARH